jgi:ankyrin repeat protein
MNIEKADYGTIIQFGSLDDVKQKLKTEEKSIADVIDIIDENGMSLLEKSLVARKFDIAKYLLDNNAKVNIISNSGCNEFHYIASNINCDGAIQIARILLRRGTSLILQDKRFGNSAIFTLCMEIFKSRTVEGLAFLEECILCASDIDACNKNGYNLRTLISERGTDRLKNILEEKDEQ